MDISRSLLCLCVLMVLTKADYGEVTPCSDETPCQPGFLCSLDLKCKPSELLLDLLFKPQSSVHISAISPHRFVRRAKPFDEASNREMLIQLGNEGIEGDDHSKPALKGTHRKHKHHQHKQRKHKVHQRDTGVVGMPERVSLQIREDETTTSSNKSLNSADQSSDRLQELNPTEEWTTLDNKDKADSLPKYSRKSKRSTHTLPQWQKALALLTLSKMAGATHPITNAESDASKQVDILDKIIHQLGEEVASKSVTSHGHHRQHPSVDTEAKKEEIETLKDIENSLVQHTNSQSDSGISHDHGSEHSHKHTQQHGHGTDSHSKLTENTVQPSLEELEGMVVQDITKAEDEGMTKKQEVQLEKEIEGLEVLEQESIKDLIKNGGSQTNLDEVEDKVQLWGVLQQLVEKLKTELPNTKPSREARSAGVDITERGSLLSLFQHTMSNPRAKRHHKQTHSAKPTAAITNQPTTAMSPDTNSLNVEEDEIGRVDQEHCQHCESLIGEEVCGANGKTYISLCHAVNCAGLRESDIIAGRCVTEDECASNKCSEMEECVPMLHGTCLTLYSRGGLNRVPCRRYVCVSKEECENDANHEQICGEDGKTYPSLCYLHKAGVQLAYTGSCRPHLCRGEVCGRDGITYKSSCHARAHGVRIDYNGRCFTEDKYGKLVNCATVRDAGRCVKPLCSDPVVPAGSCCPVCGGAVVVHPDSAALSELVASWEEVNHLYIVENFLRHLLSKTEASKCELTATLMNNGSFSVVLSAFVAKYHKLCQTATNNLVRTINKSPAAQDAMLHPVALKATLLNALNPEAMFKGYLLNAQNKAISKASDLRDEALTKANQALVDADRHVKIKQSQMEVERALENSAPGHSLPLFMTLTGIVMCVLL